MSNRLYSVITLLEAKKGHENALKDELLKLRGPSLEESGCMSYYLYESTNHPSQFMIFQNWISPEAQKEHSASQHVADWIKRANKLLAKPYEMSYWEIIK